jgi:hypothetical protein
LGGISRQHGKPSKPCPLRYLKDASYSPEREMRVSLSALGMGEFAYADGSTMAFNDSLQVQFDFRAAFADGTIKQILMAPGSNLDFLRAEFGKLGITAIEGRGVEKATP